MTTTTPTPAATAEGYFLRGRSVLRMVHEERAVGLLYGQRALAIGALNPVNFIGTMAHTRGRARPFKRLTRTAKMFESIYFGSREEADEVLAAVHHMHQSVSGELPDRAGPFPAGTPYSAVDPELMLWTVAVTADSAQVFYEMFVRRLSEEEREALWSDYLRFGELFGMARDAAPASYGEFREYWNDRLYGDRMHLTDDARFVAMAIMFEIPVPPLHQPAMRVHNLLMLGSLPKRVRELYGLRWTRAHEISFRAAVAGLRAPRPVAPRRLRSGANDYFFDLVADTEQARFDRGEPIPGALD